MIVLCVQQVVFQASCCQRWFECSECHDEINDHLFQFNKRLKMFCKTCNTTFERDLKLMTVKDKYCYSCGTCWCIPGKLDYYCSCDIYNIYCFIDVFLLVGVSPESIITAEGLAHMDDGLQYLLNNAGKTL